MFISKEKLRILKGKVQYLKWKIQSRRSRSQGNELYDVSRVYWIEPTRIKLSLDSPARDRLNEDIDTAPITPMLERGKIMGGDWDKKTIDFEQQDVWQAFRQHFKEGRNWNATEFYQRVIKTIDGGIPMWRCTTKEEFDIRLVEIEKLYNDIKERGYRQQSEIDNSGYKPFGNEDEVQVHIGRNGDYIFGDGRHRLCIAKLLELPRIPVKVARRHEDWVQFRKEILSYAARQPSRKLYAGLTHPDLNDIPAVHESADRFQLIRDNLPVSSGTLLDIGSHWGYFCHRFEQLGFSCTATEYLDINQYFLKKLRDVEGRDFRIINDSILNYHEKHHFDVVLALNIFHHFIKTETEYKKLEKLLRRLDADSLFFESHAPDEPQMNRQGVYKNFQPDEFAEWVQKQAGLSKKQYLGETFQGRRLYYFCN